MNRFLVPTALGVLLVAVAVLWIPWPEEVNPTSDTPEEPLSPAGDAGDDGDATQRDIEPGMPDDTDAHSDGGRNKALQDMSKRCADVMAALTRAGGDEYTTEVGNTLIYDRQWSPEQVIELCSAQAGKTDADVAAAFSEASGVVLPAQ